MPPAALSLEDILSVLVSAYAPPAARARALELLIDAPQAESVPLLLAWLDEHLADPGGLLERVDEDGDLSNDAILSVLLLLGHARVPEAHERLLRLLSLEKRLSYDLLGDFSTEDAPSVLVETFSGDTAPLVALACNTAAGTSERGVAISALVILTLQGQIPRALLVDLLPRLMGPDEPDVDFRTTAAEIGVAIRPQEHLALLAPLLINGDTVRPYEDIEELQAALADPATEAEGLRHHLQRSQKPPPERAWWITLELASQETSEDRIRGMFEQLKQEALAYQGYLERRAALKRQKDARKKQRAAKKKKKR